MEPTIGDVGVKVTAEKRTSYLLNNVPDDLWDKLREDAGSRETPDTFTSANGRTYPPRRTERTGTSLNNVVGEILAARYELGFEPTRRATFDQESESRALYLRLPEDLMGRVRREARKSSVRYVLLLAFAEHYGMGLDVDPPRRAKAKHGRPRGRKVRR